MKIDKVEHFATCRSMKDGERCRFFAGMPPLKPGFDPNPEDPELVPGGKHEELFPPEGLGDGAHLVYLVHGEDTADNECAVFVLKDDTIPVAWLVQDGDVFTGSRAIKRVFGRHVDVEMMHDPSGAIERMREACDRLARSFPGVKYVFGVDTGTGMTFQSNDSDLMTIHREAHDASAT